MITRCGLLKVIAATPLIGWFLGKWAYANLPGNEKALAMASFREGRLEQNDRYRQSTRAAFRERKFAELQAERSATNDQ